MKRLSVTIALLFSLISMLVMIIYLAFSMLILSFQPAVFLFYLILITFLIGLPAIASLRMPVAGGILQMIIGFALLYSFLNLAQENSNRYAGIICGSLLFLSGFMFFLSNFLKNEQVLAESKSEKNRILTIPNFISMLRIVISIMLPFIVFQIDINLLRILVAAIFLSDFFDGYLARKLNSASKFGTLLDPFADRLSVFAISISLFLIDRLPLPVLILFFLREIGVLIGFLIVKRYTGREIRVLPEGKKVAALVYSLLVSLLFFEGKLGVYVGWLSVLLYYFSLYFYLKSIYSRKMPVNL